MKLAELRVDRCGVWRNLTLPLNADGVSVIYGPNEAGKSTLTRFIRGVLYGFGATAEPEGGSSSSASAGALLVNTAAGQHLVHRAAPAGQAGKVSLPGDETDRSADDLLAELLQRVDGRTFDTFFSVNLHELMELSTLSAEQSARHIYGLSLGPDGRRLIAALGHAHESRGRLVDSLQRDGQLVRLFERQDQLQAELRAADGKRRRHDECRRLKGRYDHEISELRSRQSGIHEQLRGHRYLQRAAKPWQTLQQTERALARLPVIASFPRQGAERLESIQQKIEQATTERDAQLAEVDGLRRELRGLARDQNVASCATAVKGLLAQRGWLEELDRRQTAARQAAAEAELEFSEMLSALGDDWTEQKLAGFDLSAAAWQQLAGRSHSLSLARARRAACKRRARAASAACREMRDSLVEYLDDLDGQPVEDALAEARERLRQAHHLARLQLREAELNQRQFGLHEHCERIGPQLTLPGWVHIVLGTFCFMGIVLAGWGLFAGAVTSGIAGAIYALLGITCVGLAWGLKAQFEGDAQRRMDELQTQLADAIAELREVRQSIQRLTQTGVGEVVAAVTAGAGSAAGPKADAKRPEASQGSEYIRLAAERVAELVDVARNERTLQSLRRRRVACRKTFRIADREATTALDAWHELLEQLGFPAEIGPPEALQAWQRLFEAHEVLSRCRQRREEDRSLESIWSEYREQIGRLARRIPQVAFNADRPLETLRQWEEQLVEFAGVRRKHRELKTALSRARSAAAELQPQLDDLKLQLHALLTQGGAASVEEFLERSAQLAERRELELERDEAQRCLAAVCADHADLALVEEDLRAFDPAHNSQCIETLELEADDLEQDLQKALQQLDDLVAEMELLEGDREAAGLRFDLAQVHEQLRQAAREWAVVEAAAQAGDDLRLQYERRNQPAALVRASHFLHRLTGGRYVRVWAPLGQRHLLVDDDRGRTLSAQALSRGTREQLFFAVRLAVVDGLALQGVTLPLILDDVFVNFDDRRAEAAVHTLCEFAAAGHQVLMFTCHQHVAELFRNEGTEPIRLPAHADDLEDREATRRAG